MTDKTKKKLPPKLDPVLPIQAGGEIPPIRPGEGADIMQMTSGVALDLPYRAFYTLWEIAEAKARVQYPKYVTWMPHVAEMWAEAVLAFRNAHRASSGLPPLKLYTEEKAQKARRILAKHEKAEAERKRAAAAKARAAKQGKSTDAGEAPTEPSKARKSPKATPGRPRTKKEAQKRKQKAKKKS